MDALFDLKVAELQLYIEKINPLATILDEATLDSYLLTTDLLNATDAVKKDIKKKYYDYCRKIHPDKTGENNEDTLYVYKHFGEAILRHSEAEYDSVWMFMGFAAVKYIIRSTLLN